MKWYKGNLDYVPPVKPTKCSVDGCNGKYLSIGLCSIHYDQKRRRDKGIYPRRVLGCSVEGCEGKHEAMGLCKKHYARKHYKETFVPKEITINVCSVSGCKNKYYASGFCSHHYNKEFNKNRNKLINRRCVECGNSIYMYNKSGLCQHCCRIGKRNKNFGVICPPEVREKISKANLGRNSGAKHTRWAGGSYVLPSRFYSIRPKIRKEIVIGVRTLPVILQRGNTILKEVES